MIRILKLKTNSRPSCNRVRVEPRTNRPLLTCWCVALCLLPVLVGCDDRPRRVEVSGKVLIDGEPVPYGSVTFVPEGQRPSAGKLDENGNFTLTCFDGGDGTVLGTHRVQISSSDLRGKSVKWYAPREYSDFRTSGITIEVTEPVDDLVIELTWGGKKPGGRKRK